MDTQNKAADLARYAAAFDRYTNGVVFVSPEAKEAAKAKYIAFYAEGVESPTNEEYLYKPTLSPEDVVSGYNIPDYVLAYDIANMGLEEVRRAYDKLDTALQLIGRKDTAEILKEVSAAIWNAERERETIYGKLTAAGGTILPPVK